MEARKHRQNLSEDRYRCWLPMSVINDNIGNRKQFTQDSETTSYSANSLNQYSAITNNGSPVVTAFDSDGNMITNGGWTYSWNAENRMVSAFNGSTFVSYAYDYMGRMFSKLQVSGLSTQVFSYVWDGYNIVQEVSRLTDNTITNNYVWGLDLSQTLQGAGGVGGLLAVIQVSGLSPQPSAYYPCFDGNGNVCDYVDGSGAVVAHYEYSPFGGITVASESKANDFSHLFSTKPYERDTKIVRYELRDYLVDLARFLSKDPIEEEGGVNLYGFLSNDSLGGVDLLGLWREEGEEFEYRYSWEMFLAHWFNPESGTLAWKRTRQVIESQYVQDWISIVQASAEMAVQCGQSGSKSRHVEDDKYTPSWKWILTGNWQINFTVVCDWKAEACNKSTCKCPYEVDCILKGHINKRYTFKYYRDGNPANAITHVFTYFRDYVTAKGDYYIHGKLGTRRTVTGERKCKP